MFRFLVLVGTTFALGLAAFTGSAIAQDKPNILVIWGDDIGGFNISALRHDGLPHAQQGPATS
jgi:arylsulfatase